MQDADTAILAALQESRRGYCLLRVGSSTSNSNEVLPSDIDYVCIDVSDSSIRHRQDLIRMGDTFSRITQTVGFEPKWPNGDAGLPIIIQANLGQRYRCGFRFGPLTMSDPLGEIRLVHFAGPISAGDFELFTASFPVLSYMFLKYGKCLRGNIDSVRKSKDRPSLAQFVDLLLANSERGLHATEPRPLVVAVQKALLLQAVWHDRSDPYHSSRIAARAWIGREIELLEQARLDPQRFILQTAGGLT